MPDQPVCPPRGEQLSMLAISFDETEAALQRALALEARRTGTRFVAAVMCISGSLDEAEGDHGGVRSSEHAAAQLLGYMHRYDAFQISVYAAGSDTVESYSPRQLFEVANGASDHPDIAEGV